MVKYGEVPVNCPKHHIQWDEVGHVLMGSRWFRHVETLWLMMFDDVTLQGMWLFMLMFEPLDSGQSRNTKKTRTERSGQLRIQFLTVYYEQNQRVKNLLSRGASVIWSCAGHQHGRREGPFIFSSFDFDCRSWCDAAAIDCYLKNAIAAQLLGIIIHKTHGEDLYIIDKFPKAGC